MLIEEYFCPGRRRSITNIRTKIALVVVLAAVCCGVSAQPRAKNMTILAVMDIQDNSGKLKATDVQSASDYLRGLLAQSGRFEVVDKGRQNSKLVEVVKTLKRESYDPCFDDRCRIQLGRAVSADTLLRCTIGAVGTACMLNCELVILEKETAADAAVQRFACGPEGLVDAVEKVAGQLRGSAVEQKIEERTIGQKAEEWRMNVQTGVLVSFKSDPVGAVVLVDGRLQCSGTPCSKTLAEGSHKVEMQKESYVPEATNISVGQGMKPVRMTLTPDFGWLTVSSEPNGLPVQVDGRQVGSTPLSRHQVSTGPHEVLVADPRYYDSGKQVQVDRGETEEVRVELLPREGGLVVNARDKLGNDLAAEVWLDKTRVGTTPLAKQVLIGRHKLRVVHGGHQVEQDVEVREKQVKNIAVELKGGEGESGASGGDGTWTFPKSGLTWQVTPTGGAMNWSNARKHCAGLSLDGVGWRLPTIGELRTLLRGCPGSATGGACKVSDSCLASSCWDKGGCGSCSKKNGPADGCYWPDEMQGPCDWYWSSSPVEDGDGFAWYVSFYYGYFYYVAVDYVYRHGGAYSAIRVRCVRDAP